MFSFKERYPNFYNGMLGKIIHSDFIEHEVYKEQVFGELISISNPYEGQTEGFSIYRDFLKGSIAGVEDFITDKTTSPDPLIDVCRDFYNEECHAEDKRLFEDRFIDENGVFDFYKFWDAVPETDSLVDALSAELYQDEEIYTATENAYFELEKELEDEPEQDEEER